MPVIEVNNVTKEYRLGTLTSSKTAVLNQLKRLTTRLLETHKPCKATSDIGYSRENSKCAPH